MSYWYSFNWVDYSILGIIVFSTVVSFFRGFLREAVSLVVWVVGILVAMKFANPMQHYLISWIDSTTLRYVIVFTALFLVILVIGALISKLIQLFVHKVGLNVMDRFLGIIFGGARGVVIVSVLLMFFGMGGVQSTETLTESQLAPYFKPLVSWLNNYLPEQLKELSGWIGNTENL